MNSINDYGIPDIHVNGLYALDTAYLDADEQTLNLIFSLPDDSPKYRADISVDPGRKPKVLFIGDSFINDLETYLPWKDIMAEVEVWFYNKTAIKNFEEKRPIDDINRLRSLLDADYVVWYSSGYQWNLTSYDFVEDALLRLCVTDSLFEAQIPWVMDSLRHDSAFSIRNRASQKLDSYADTLRKYAIKAIKDYPELIPGLDGEAMPTIRNTQAIQIAQQANRIDADKQWKTALRVEASRCGHPYEDVLQQEVGNVINGRPLLRQEITIDTAVIFQLEVEKLMNQWRNNEESIKYLEDKAKERGMTFEEMLEADARWVVNERLRNGELF
jgi:hypothetical protein